MVIRPVLDKIVIKPDPTETTTASGLVLAREAVDENAQDQGTVIAVGPGQVTDGGVLIEMTVKEGDRVVYNKHANAQSTVQIEGEDYVILTEESIFAVL